MGCCFGVSLTTLGLVDAKPLGWLPTGETECTDEGGRTIGSYASPEESKLGTSEGSSSICLL